MAAEFFEGALPPSPGEPPPDAEAAASLQESLAASLAKGGVQVQWSVCVCVCVCVCM